MVSDNFAINILNVDDAVLTSRQIYYKDSDFDDGDMGAVAPGKSVLEVGQTATFANYTSYWRGINGFVIDLNDLNQAPTTGTVGDFFEFHVGNDDTPADWTAATSPTLVYQDNVDASGTDRVFLTWADNAIENTWLEITVLANESTGLVNPDLFYIGNAIGETGNDSANAIVNLADVAGVRANQTGFGSTDISDPYDFDRNERVNLIDLSIARSNQSGFSPLKLITPSSGGSRGSGWNGFGSDGKPDFDFDYGLTTGFDSGAKFDEDQGWNSKSASRDQGQHAARGSNGSDGVASLRLSGSQNAGIADGLVSGPVDSENVKTPETSDRLQSWNPAEVSQRDEIFCHFGVWCKLSN